jgi:hypothetical protein
MERGQIGVDLEGSLNQKSHFTREMRLSQL